MCRKTYEEMKWLRKDFVSFYVSAKQSGANGECLFLSGAADRINQTKSEVKLIGIEGRTGNFIAMEERKQITEPKQINNLVHNIASGMISEHK